MTIKKQINEIEAICRAHNINTSTSCKEDRRGDCIFCRSSISKNYCEEVVADTNKRIDFYIKNYKEVRKILSSLSSKNRKILIDSMPYMDIRLLEAKENKKAGRRRRR